MVETIAASYIPMVYGAAFSFALVGMECIYYLGKWMFTKIKVKGEHKRGYINKSTNKAA